MNVALRKIFTKKLPYSGCNSLAGPQVRAFAVNANRKPGANNYEHEFDVENEFDLDQLQKEMKSYYEEQFTTIKEENESILKTYERQMKTARENLAQQQVRLKREKFDKAVESHFADIPVKEFMNRSKKLADSIRLNTSWSPYDKTNAYQNTFDYEKFKGNEIEYEDFKHDPDDIGEFAKGQSIEKFVANLTKDNREARIAANEALSTDSSDEAVNRDWNAEEFLPGPINEGEYDPIPPTNPPRLSPWAREELYKLHLEGWSVRDLSLRFGILPVRVKAIIFLKQMFYEEYLPKMSFDHLKMAFEFENEEGGPFVDYGIDLQLMAQQEQGVPIRRFRMKASDLDPNPDIKEKMQKLLEAKRRKKWDQVVEGFVGKGNRGYFVKSWHIYRGRASERVNKKFKNIVEHADEPQLLTTRNRKLMSKGPRIASLGYGPK